MTELETKVFDFIKDNTDEDSMECVDINDLSNGLNESPNVLRGVVASLVKKDLIWVEEYDANMETNYFYWVR